MKNAVDMPSLAEPFFMNLKAKVDIVPVMDAKDMQAGVRKAMQEK